MRRRSACKTRGSNPPLRQSAPGTICHRAILLIKRRGGELVAGASGCHAGSPQGEVGLPDPALRLGGRPPSLHRSLIAIEPLRGLGRIGLREERPPHRAKPTRELIHVDVKKLGQINSKGAGHRDTGIRGRTLVPRTENGKQRRAAGSKSLTSVSTTPPPSYVKILPDERGTSAAWFCDARSADMAVRLSSPEPPKAR